MFINICLCADMFVRSVNFFFFLKKKSRRLLDSRASPYMVMHDSVCALLWFCCGCKYMAECES